MEIQGIHRLQYEQNTKTVGQMDISPDSAQRPAFGEILKAKSLEPQGLNFSRHAAKRMDERGITVDHQLMDHLKQAVEGARRKGAKDVAVIGSQGVFIVNVPNNVVVTTMSADDMRDRIFTNIDSAVIL